MANAPVRRMSVAEYLAGEQEQGERHEYVHGDVFCMAGGSPRHAALQGAMSGILWTGHRDGPCRVLGTDMRIVAEDGEHYVYADVSVVCGPSILAEGTEDVLTNPSIVVEVLSKSTEAYDRGKKWERYQKIPAVMDYVLVSQSEAHLEHYQREDSRQWRYRSVGPGGHVTLKTGATIDVDTLYHGVFDLKGD